MKKVFGALNSLTPFTEKSVLLDLGSGAGLPCIYAALEYGIKAYGVELDPDLVAIAQRYAEQAGVSNLVSFSCESISQPSVAWYREHGVTHVYSFDEVFKADSRSKMFEPISRLQLTGASSKRFKGTWPRAVELRSTVNRVMLAGGMSGFAFGIWKTCSPESRDRSPVRSS